MNDETLKKLLASIEPEGRDVLRRLMRADRPERDEFAEALMRLDAPSAIDFADLIDSATVHPEMRRRVARLLGELEAESPL